MTDARSRRRTALRAAALAAIALTASACGASLQSLPKFGGQSGPTYTVTATFANVVNLPADAEVRVGAFSVGNVTSIGLNNFQAVVRMHIRKDVHLPVGTTAQIRFDTPLGDDFVQLQPPSAKAGTTYLANDARIPETATSSAPSVEDTLGALGALLNGGGINQLQTIIDQTNLALSGNQQDIRALLQNLDTTVASLASNTPSIDDALTAMATLSNTLQQGSSTIANGLAALGPAANVLANETNQINAITGQLSKLGTAASAIVDASETGTVQTVDALNPLLTQLTSVKAQIGPALTALDALEAYTPRAVPGNYLQLSVHATIGVPPVPADAEKLKKITVDPPDPAELYSTGGSYTYGGEEQLLEGGLP